MTDNKKDILIVEGLSKHFGGIKAVDNVSFSVKPGEVVGILGDNGAGKSTLIKMISGVYEADKGKVYFKDTDITKKSTREIREIGIETIYQDLALADNLDASVNIFLGRELIRNRLFNIKDTKSMIEDSEKTLRELGFELPDIRRIVRDLSGGQRQGVAIARAVHWQASLLIMDEPTAAVGVSGRRKIYSLVSDLKNKGVSVVYVTPNIREAFNFLEIDKIIVMKNGRKIFEKEMNKSSIEEVTAYMMSAKQ